MKISNKYHEFSSAIEYLLVAFIASCDVSSAIPGITATVLPTKLLWFNSAKVYLQDQYVNVDTHYYALFL